MLWMREVNPDHPSLSAEAQALGNRDRHHGLSVTAPPGWHGAWSGLQGLSLRLCRWTE